jgi:hypothetical protein
MKNKMKFVKLIFFGTLISYLFSLLAFFAYMTYEEDAFVALLLTDLYFIRGPIMRLQNPVTKDEEMIANFAKNRESFEKLIQIKNEKCLITSGTGPQIFLEHPETTLLKQKIGLKKFKSPGDSLWLPDPYSHKAIEEGRLINQEFALKSREFPPDEQTGERPTTWKKFSEEHRVKICKYEAAYFVWEEFPTTALLKGVTYFPSAPKVEHGKLYRPNLSDAEKPYQNEKVIQNLENFPTGFWNHQRNCVYRKIEAKWYLFVCPG